MLICVLDRKDYYINTLSNGFFWCWLCYSRKLSKSLCFFLCYQTKCTRYSIMQNILSISSTNWIDRHDIAEILLKVALKTIALTHILSNQTWSLPIFHCEYSYGNCRMNNPFNCVLCVSWFTRAVYCNVRWQSLRWCAKSIFKLTIVVRG